MLIPLGDSGAGGDAVLAAAPKQKGAFTLFKQVPARQRNTCRAFGTAGRKGEGENITAVLGINGNIYFVSLRGGGKIQLFKYAQPVQIILGFFIDFRRKCISWF